MTPAGTTPSRASGEEEVCRSAADLIRIDTTNRGGGDAVGERAAAEYVAAHLADVGLEPRIYERAVRRSNVVTRWAGTDPTRPALVVHGHLDVVPADRAEWSVDPFGGEIRDGMLWGRGAVDMKNMVAMVLASVRELTDRGVRPRRDVILTFLADEEDNSHHGARWLVEAHPEVFDGADTAIGEVGGFSTEIRGTTVFLVQSGEKGILWLRLRSRGRAGHASQVNDRNAVVDLARAVLRICDEPWPIALTATTTALFDALRSLSVEGDPEQAFASVGAPAAFVVPALRTTAAVTMFEGGDKQNVIPGAASALIDVRVLPGERDRVLDRIRELAGADIDVIVEDDVAAVEAPFTGPLIDAIRSSLGRRAPGARVAPYLLPAGTDNAVLASLGIHGYGFVPMRLPADYDVPAMFHGVDERVPLDALVFGQSVLSDLLETY